MWHHWELLLYIIGTRNLAEGTHAPSAYCTGEQPCGLGEGECIGNSTCSGDLVCGYDNCPLTGRHHWYQDCCQTENDLYCDQSPKYLRLHHFMDASFAGLVHSVDWKYLNAYGLLFTVTGEQAGTYMAYSGGWDHSGSQETRLIKLEADCKQTQITSASWLCSTEMDHSLAWVTLVICVVISAVHFVGALLKRHELKALFKKCSVMFGGTLRRIHACKRSHVGDDDDEESTPRILRIAAAHRTRKALAAFRVLSAITWLTLLPLAFSLSLTFFELKESAWGTRNYATGVLVRDMIPLSSIALCCAFFAWLPRCITTRCLDVANVVLAAVWIWKTAMLANTHYYDTSLFHYQQTWVIFCRTFQGILFGNASLTTMLHIIWVVCDICMFSWLDSSLGRAPAAHHASDYAFRQIALGAAAIGLSWAAEISMLSEAKAIWAKEKSAGAHGQSSRVLKAMCDAVVTLDSRLRVTGGTKKLKTLLMMPSSDILNRHFTNFIRPEDRDRLKACVEREAREATSFSSGEAIHGHAAQTFHLHLQDRHGLQFPAQIFCSALMDVDGEIEYILGIRQDADAETLGSMAMQQQVAVTVSSFTSPDSLSPRQDSLSPRQDAGRDADRAYVASIGRDSASIGRDSASNRRNKGTCSQSSATGSLRSKNSGSSRGLIGKSCKDMGKRDEDFWITPLSSIDECMASTLKYFICDMQNHRAVRCCPLHLAVWTLECSLKRVRNKPCNKSFRSMMAGKQCVTCKMMQPLDADECCFCEGDRFFHPRAKQCTTCKKMVPDDEFEDVCGFCNGNNFWSPPELGPEGKISL